VLPQRRIVLTNPAHGMTDRPGHADAGAFRRGTGAPAMPSSPTARDNARTVPIERPDAKGASANTMSRPMLTFSLFGD
jgi:hypothetical protein